MLSSFHIKDHIGSQILSIFKLNHILDVVITWSLQLALRGYIIIIHFKLTVHWPLAHQNSLHQTLNYQHFELSHFRRLMSVWHKASQTVTQTSCGCRYHFSVVTPRSVGEFESSHINLLTPLMESLSQNIISIFFFRFYIFSRSYSF